MWELEWLVDYREPEEIARSLSRASGIPYRKANLDVGDYVLGEVGFERKSLDFLKFDDVLAKASELAKMYEKPYLVVELSLEELVSEALARGGIRMARGLLGLVGALSALGVPPIFAGSRELMIEVMASIARKSGGEREPFLRPIKTRPTSLDDWRVNVLIGLPKISVKRARALLERFGSLRRIANASASELMRVEGIGEKIAREIHEIFWGKYGGRDKGIQPLRR